MPCHRSLLPALLVLALGSPAAADTLIKTRVQQSAIEALGRAAEDSVSTTWIGDNRSRVDLADTSVIVDGPGNAMYFVDHGRKAYAKLDLPIDIKQLVPEEMAAMVETMMATMKTEVSISTTEETKKFGPYATKLSKVRVANAMGMNIDIDLWMAQDVAIDFVAFRSFQQKMAELQPLGVEWMKRIIAIEGYPVLKESRMEVMGKPVQTREELVSVETKPAPAGTYLPNADYKAEKYDVSKALER